MADPVTDQPGALLARMPAIVAVDDGVGQPPTAPAPGESFPMQDNVVHYAGQPIAIVVAESHEGAQYAAAQVAVSYEPRSVDHRVDHGRDAYERPGQRWTRTAIGQHVLPPVLKEP